MSIRTFDAYTDGDAIEEMLKSGCPFPLTVTGTSMAPFLKNGRDTVWLVPYTGARRGKIIFFRRSDGSFVLHRIRKIRADGTLTVNGDSQRWMESVTPGQIAAEVSAITHRGKKRDASSFLIRLRDTLWYPTRPFRPALVKCSSAVKRLIRHN